MNTDSSRVKKLNLPVYCVIGEFFCLKQWFPMWMLLKKYIKYKSYRSIMHSLEKKQLLYWINDIIISHFWEKFFLNTCPFFYEFFSLIQKNRAIYSSQVNALHFPKMQILLQYSSICITECLAWFGQVCIRTSTTYCSVATVSISRFFFL